MAGCRGTPRTVTGGPTAWEAAVVLGKALFRIGKQRLVITATSSNANAILTLNPYVTSTGTTFDPLLLGNVFTVVNGVPTLTLVGAPPPACGNPAGYLTPCPATPLVVISNFGGVSPARGLDRIRQ